MNAKLGKGKTGLVILLLVLLILSIGRVIPVFAAAPSNDDLTSPTVVVSLPYTDAINTVEATVEGSEPLYDCGWNVGKTVWYSYTPGATGDVFVNTQGSNFSTVLHVFNQSGMALVGCDSSWQDSQLLFTATVGTTYLIGVGGYDGAAGDLILNMAEPGPFSSCAGAGLDVSVAECDALVALYTATDGVNWDTKTRWLETDLVCTWFGISCYNGVVTQLKLGNNSLDGALSVDLSGLSNLWNLNISQNNLTGDMAVVIGNLPTGLTILYLYSNGFTGTIPSSVSSIGNLWIFDISSNQLSGDIAEVFLNLPLSIGYLTFNDNDYYGTIPAAALTLINLQAIEGSNNLLAGNLTTAIGNLPTGLTHLYLSGNAFTGTIPSSISSFSNLQRIRLADNLLTGDLATIIGYLPTTIEYLYIQDNGFTGSIPAEISNLVNLSRLVLNNNPGLGGTIPLSITGLSLDYFEFENTFFCEPPEGTYLPWKSGIASYLPGYCEPAISWLFEDDFETGDFSLWSRFNDGNGYLYPCIDAVINGYWGACVDRGTDKRKQLIDETPINQVKYNVRFNIDMNSLSMAEGTRFRFIQVKMGAERPFFIVVKYQGGQYLIQLNTLRDDLSKVKTGWYLLSDAPHTIEVTWLAASGAGSNDGIAAFYLDNDFLESLVGLDNETIFVDTFKIGFTSRLDGKPISGIFYLDDIATSNSGHIGLVEP